MILSSLSLRFSHTSLVLGKCFFFFFYPPTISKPISAAHTEKHIEINWKGTEKEEKKNKLSVV